MPDPSAWRIDKEKWASSSFDGSGAAKEGGRWNSAGVRVVYCSMHLAMAAQEKYVHLPKPVPGSIRFVKFRIDFGSLAIERRETATLPTNWRVSPPPKDVQRVGDEWVKSGRTAILAIPSVLIPEEINFLLNPLHPDFAKIRIEKPEPFEFDPRIAALVER